MIFWRASFVGEMTFLAVALVLCGCGPAGLTQSDEQKEPHFLAGKSRISTMDYEGAIECFEKALQVNPQSASAHFELGWLYDQEESDPSAAIYHYDRYLRLCSKADNAELIKQRILICKQELARTVSLGPITERQQRDFEQLSEEKKRLIQENQTLHEDLDKWIAYARTLQALTNRAVSSRSPQTSDLRAATSGAVSPPNPTGSTRPAQGTASISHTHTVKPGENPNLIARQYGIKLDVLMAANPGVNPRRLQVGQSLNIPSP
jgi:LysM repeat protein